jgi:hydroxyethylthiazole kinase
LPWVLDPVFVDRAPPRAVFARELIGKEPAVVRLNHTEFAALAGGALSRDQAMAFARTNGVVVALSGETDLVTDGNRAATIANGHPLMTNVTAMGCAGSAILAACLAVEPDAFRAAVAALLIAGVAGELAAEQSTGPGSFAVAIIDALYNLDGPALVARARVE